MSPKGYASSQKAQKTTQDSVLADFTNFNYKHNNTVVVLITQHCTS